MLGWNNDDESKLNQNDLPKVFTNNSRDKFTRKAFQIAKISKLKDRVGQKKTSLS